MRCLTTPGRQAPRRPELFDGPDDPKWPEYRDFVAHDVLDPWARRDSESLTANGRRGQPASTWNYRVVQSSDGTEYFIAEVYYDGNVLSWVDGTGDCLRWDRHNDLKGTIELIQQAFDKPVLRVTGDGRLVEVSPT